MSENRKNNDAISTFIENAMKKNSKKSTVEFSNCDIFLQKNVEILENMLHESDNDLNRKIGLPKSSGINESIEMRFKLIDWLRQINAFRQSKPGVLAVTVDIVDRYVYSVTLKNSSFIISKDNYQCVGAAAYYLASKVEEVSPVLAKDLTQYSMETCLSDDIQHLELLILLELGSRTRYVNTVDFIFHLMTFVDLTHDTDKMKRKSLLSNAVVLFNKVIDNYSILQFPAYVVAINSIVIAFFDMDWYLKNDQMNTSTLLVDHCNANKAQLRNCYQIFMSLVFDDESEEDDEEAEQQPPVVANNLALDEAQLIAQ